MFVCFTSLEFAGARFSGACVFVGAANFLGLEFSFCTFYRAGFVDRLDLWIDIV